MYIAQCSECRVRDRWFSVLDAGFGVNGKGVSVRDQTVRSTTLFKLKNLNPTRLVQKPKRTRFRGKSENVYSGTRTLCLIDRGKTRESVYRSTHYHFCP